MSSSQNQKALQALQETLEHLSAACGTYEGSERYWRSWQRSRDYVAAARRAQTLLEAALDALEEPARNVKAEENKGWLSRKVKGLAQHWGHEEGAEDDDQSALNGELQDATLRNQWASKSSGQALEGNGGVVELPDLIGMIRAQGMTGILNLSLPKEVVQLHFDKGQLVHAYSENAPKSLRLGEILVEQGVMDQERLKSLLYCHKNSPKMLGEILMDGGVVAPEHLHQALHYQIQCLFDRLFTHRKQAHFRFEPGLPDTTAQRAQVNVLQLLLESARAYDERQAS